MNRRQKIRLFTALVLASVVLLATLLVQTQNLVTVREKIRNSNNHFSSHNGKETNNNQPIEKATAEFEIIKSPVQEIIESSSALYQNLFQTEEFIKNKNSIIADSIDNEIDSNRPSNTRMLPMDKHFVQQNGPGPAPYQFFPGNSLSFVLGMIETRLKIELEEAERNLRAQKDPQQALDAWGNQTHQVLIFSYFRGGTTFFAELLSELPGAFLHFEPLHSISQNDQVYTPAQTERALKLVRDLMTCQYDTKTVRNYLKWASRKENQFLLSRHRRLWNSCRFRPQLCSAPKFLQDACNIYAKYPFHIQIVKLVRLRLRYAKLFLDNFPDLKVVHLMRDPRAMYASRLPLKWCNETQSCIEPSLFCADTEDDTRTAEFLRQQYPDRFMEIKHENMALNPTEVTIQVLRFLGRSVQPLPDRLERFLMTHTSMKFKGKEMFHEYIEKMLRNRHPMDIINGFRMPHNAMDLPVPVPHSFPLLRRTGNDLRDPYSTRRDSQSTVDKWRNSLKPFQVRPIEVACSKVLKQYGYPFVLPQDELEMISTTIQMTNNNENKNEYVETTTLQPSTNTNSAPTVPEMLTSFVSNNNTGFSHTTV